ncbi:MAG: carbohydrate hydrolase [Paenibacillaceae bacterium ZCTH02-B3]|nr:MAG: carbohydrate hydrolase [Paenibacillaceae bacterium ZCTH02-B3]
MKFNGYVRENGKVGIRNHVLVMSSVGCANTVVEKISAQTGANPITHQQGCLQLGVDQELTKKTLIGAGNNPNIGAVLIVGLGCETVQPTLLAEHIKGKRVEYITIQECGGTTKAVEKGVAIVREMQKELEKQKREPVDISHLIIGLKCGGSDTFSGLTANPVLGYVSDRLVDLGGTVILSETPGFFGGDRYLRERIVTEEGRKKFDEILNTMWQESSRLGETLADGELSPGNIKGGLTTLIEKSLGGIKKGGSRPIQGVLDFADEITGKGLWIMDTPGFDIITISGQTAGGAQMILFTTGRGSPVGCTLSPVIKVCSNSKTYEWMNEDMDINAGKIIDEGLPISEVGEELLMKMIEVANGEPTKSELAGHKEFALARVGSTL